MKNLVAIQVFVLAGMICDRGAVGQEQQVNDFVYPNDTSLHAEYRMLIKYVAIPNQGIQVTDYASGGPAAWMWKPDGATRYFMRKGDTIIAINHVLVDSSSKYLQALNYFAKAHNGIIDLTIRDAVTGVTSDYLAKPVQVMINKPIVGPVPKSSYQVKILLIALTKDDKIGPAISVSLRHLQESIRTMPNVNLAQVVTLQSEEATKTKIMKTITDIDVDEDDTLFVYYIGHGAYDNDLAVPGDSSNGHYFQLPSGALPRYELTEAMRAKKARLTVLISDCCDAEYPADRRQGSGFEYTALRDVIHTGDSVIWNELLFKHSGMLDVNACDRNQFSWFTPEYGGWFTEAILSTLHADAFDNSTFVSWKLFLNQTQSQLSIDFATRKEKILTYPQLNPEVRQAINSQDDETVQIFTNKLRINAKY